jgi:RING-type zinc-finger
VIALKIYTLAFFIMLGSGLVNAGSRLFKDHRGVTCCNQNEKIVCVGDKVTYNDPKNRLTMKDILINSITQQRPTSDCVVDFKSEGSDRIWEGDHDIRNVTVVSGSSGAASAASYGGKPDPNQKCSICLDDPKNPRDLMCGHIFCRDCIRGWKGRQPGSEFTCPNCKLKQPKEIYGHKFCE